jgi:hypothetical protein
VGVTVIVAASPRGLRVGAETVATPAVCGRRGGDGRDRRHARRRRRALARNDRQPARLPPRRPYCATGSEPRHGARPGVVGSERQRHGREAAPPRISVRRAARPICSTGWRRGQSAPGMQAGRTTGRRSARRPGGLRRVTARAWNGGSTCSRSANVPSCSAARSGSGPHCARAIHTQAAGRGRARCPSGGVTCRGARPTSGRDGAL